MCARLVLPAQTLPQRGRKRADGLVLYTHNTNIGDEALCAC